MGVGLSAFAHADPDYREDYVYKLMHFACLQCHTCLRDCDAATYRLQSVTAWLVVFDWGERLVFAPGNGIGSGF